MKKEDEDDWDEERDDPEAWVKAMGGTVVSRDENGGIYWGAMSACQRPLSKADIARFNAERDERERRKRAHEEKLRKEGKKED